MRNLKKILALVLALVMSMSVMSVASADFKDASTISDEYATAVEALSALEVFKGYENGNFNPKGTITRAEVAAIIYRIDTTDIYDKQASIYADYSKFTDVSKTAWYAGYVNYCANAEYVKGVSDTEFNPNGLVTGYQVLAMILRVVGYDQNDEFTGNAWQLNVASTANQLGITRNVTADTLGKAATRELVAELLYRAIVDARQVNYTLAFGYSEYKDLDKTVYNQTIEQEKMNMYLTMADMVEGGSNSAYYRYRGALVPNTSYSEDIWGRPSEYWVAPLWTKDTLADWSDAPLATFTEAVVECELATLIGLKEETDFPVFVNGAYTEQEIEPLHTSNHKNEHKIGEQGTLMEVYPDRIILIDTYLAEVTNTVTQKTDKAGHISRYPTNEVLVYNENTVFTATEVIGDGYTFSGNNYATGEYLLVNVYEGDLTVKTSAELAANAQANGAKAWNIFVLGNPDEITGKQTKIWYNKDQHTIEGETSLDNVNYVLDDAASDKNYAYRWFFDENGYVIGSAYIPAEAVAAQYAVVLGAQWLNSGKYQERGYAYGTVQYLDGSEPVETKLYGLWDGVSYNKDGSAAITKFEYTDTKDGDFTKGELHTTYQYNKNTWLHLYQVLETENGLVLIEVTNELASAKLWDGVSLIDTTEDEIYTDNETLYFFYNYKTGMLDCVKGYDTLNKDYAVSMADVVDGKFAAQLIYLPIYEEIEEEEKDDTGYGYYYLTNDAACYTLKDHLAIFGVVDAEGKTDPLLIKLSKDADKDVAEAIVEEFVEKNLNKLFLVEFLNGYVVDMTEVIDIEAGKDDIGSWKSAMLVDGEDYEFIKTGVLKVYEGDEVAVALNVNSNTVIVNEDGVGTLADMLDLEGNDLYVIYKGTTAIAIFVVPVED